MLHLETKAQKVSFPSAKPAMFQSLYRQKGNFLEKNYFRAAIGPGCLNLNSGRVGKVGFGRELEAALAIGRFALQERKSRRRDRAHLRRVEALNS